MKKYFFLVFVLLLSLPVTLADNHNLEQTPEQKAIQKKIDGNKELTLSEFRQATEKQQQAYVLTTHFNARHPDQVKVFEKLALQKEFNYGQNMGTVKKYLDAQSRFEEKQKKIFMQAAQIDVSVVNENPFYVRMYVGSPKFSLVSGVRFQKVVDGKFIPAGPRSTPFDEKMVTRFMKMGLSKITVQKDGSLMYDYTTGGPIRALTKMDFSGTIEDSQGVGFSCTSCAVGVKKNHYGKEGAIPSLYAEGKNIKLPGGATLDEGVVIIKSKTHFDIRPTSSKGSIFTTSRGGKYFFLGFTSYVEGARKPRGILNNYVLSDIDEKAGISQLIIHAGGGITSKPRITVELLDGHPYKNLQNEGDGNVQVKEQAGDTLRIADMDAKGFSFTGGRLQMGVYNAASGHMYKDGEVNICDLQCYKIIRPLRQRVQQADAREAREAYFGGDKLALNSLARDNVDPSLYTDILADLLQSSDSDDQSRAITHIANLRVWDHPQLALHIQKLRNHPDEITRLRVIEMLPEEEQEKELFRLYSTPGISKSVKDGALVGLADLQSPLVKDELLESDHYLSALLKLKDYEGDDVDALYNRFQTHQSSGYRIAVAQRYAAMGDFQRLQEMLGKEKEPKVLENIYKGFGKIGTPQSAAILIKELEEDPRNHDAAYALVSIVGPETDDKVQKAIKSYMEGFENNEGVSRPPSWQLEAIRERLSGHEVSTGSHSESYQGLGERLLTYESGVATIDWETAFTENGLQGLPVEDVLQKVRLLDDERIDYNDVAMLNAYSVEELQDFQRNRDQLEATIAKRIKVQGTTDRIRTGYATESFDLQKHRLSLPELLKARTLLNQFQQASTREQIATFIDEDFKDRSTEYGGFIQLNGREASFQFVAPASLGVDGSHEPAKASIQGAKAGLSFFHLHAVASADTALYAGPSGSMLGGSDLGSAHETHGDGTVITPLDDCTFNVDLYTSEGAVIDLGNYNHCG